MSTGIAQIFETHLYIRSNLQLKQILGYNANVDVTEINQIKWS